MDIEKVIEEAERLQSMCDPDETLGPLRKLLGLEGDGYGISDSPEVLECDLPKSWGRVARGNNKICVDSALDGNLWFSDVCTEGYDRGYRGFPSVFGTIFRSRAEALNAAVAKFRGQLEEFPQNKPREKKLVGALQKWLDEIEMENNLQETPKADIRNKEGEQLRLGSREDGFIIPEDFETERQKKIRSELEAVTATRKQMGLLQKAYNRQALYLSIVSVIEEARSRSAGSPRRAHP